MSGVFPVGRSAISLPIAVSAITRKHHSGDSLLLDINPFSRTSPNGFTIIGSTRHTAFVSVEIQADQLCPALNWQSGRMYMMYMT
jgi:hypothetical protein